MTREEVIAKLWHLGWLSFYPSAEEAIARITEFELALAVTAYRTFHGLPPVGGIDDELIRHMQAPRCALPDILEARADLARWDENLFPITWTIKDELPGITRETRKQACAEAFARWERVSGFKSQYVENEAEANIVMTAGVIDQSGGTLAWSELPGRGTQRLKQMYDTRESWVISDTARQGVDLTRVACHELGHALGMGHISSGNLLAPTYSVSVNKPQAGDIAEMQGRYGKPTGTPTPTPIPTPIPTPTPGGTNMAEIFKAILTAILSNPDTIKTLLPILMQLLSDLFKKGQGQQAIQALEEAVAAPEVQALMAS